MGSHIPDVEIYVDSASPNTDKLFVATCFKIVFVVSSHSAQPNRMSQIWTMQLVLLTLPKIINKTVLLRYHFTFQIQLFMYISIKIQFYGMLFTYNFYSFSKNSP